MIDETLQTDLLLRWEELLEQGQEPTPEELCADFPHLLDPVRQAIVKLKRQRVLLQGASTVYGSHSAGGQPRTSAPSGTGLPAAIGPYAIVSELGRGGMGVVYRAHDPRLKRDVALKLILAGAYADAEELRLFRREAEAVAQLQHGNIVQIHEINEHLGHPFITLELVDSGSLANRLGQSPLPAQEAARLSETLAWAMQVAHDKGFVHRDLKPSNVLLTGDGIPKIADFGLAKHLKEESHTVTGAIKGTPSYMAPEQATDKGHVDPRTDVYALGAILYECLTGRPPFKGATVLDTLVQVRQQDPVPPRNLQPSVPRDLETICLKCLQKEPRKRYASARELAEDLRRFLKGEAIHARQEGKAERLARWCRRNPALATTTGTTLLALATVLGLLLGLALYQEQVRHDLQEKQQATEAAFQEAQRQYALLALDRGLALCEDGDTSRGMLFLVASLRYAAQAQDEELQQFLRISLSGWRRQMIPLKALLPHHRKAAPASFSPDGARVVTVIDNHTVQQWDVKTIQALGEPIHHEGVSAAWYSPDGQTLATTGVDRTVRLWDARTGAPRGAPLPHDNLNPVFAFSPDSKILATGCNDLLQLWNTQTGQRLRQPIQQEGTIQSVTFAPQGKKILILSRVHSRGVVRLWDVESGTFQPQLNSADSVSRAAFFPVGQAIVTSAWDAKTDKGKAQLWSTATGKPLGKPVSLVQPVTALAISPDGQRVALAQEKKAELYRVDLSKPSSPTFLRSQNTPIAVYHQRDVTSLAFSPKGAYLVTGSVDGTAQVWDVARGQRFGESLEHHGYVRAVAYSPDGHTLLTISDEGSARLWEARIVPAPVLELAKQPSSPETPPEPGLVPVPFLARQASTEVAFSPSGRTLIRVHSDEEKTRVRLWDTTTGKAIGSGFDHQGTAREISFSADERTLAHTVSPHLAQVRDATTGKPLGPPLKEDSGITVVALSPDGRMVLTGNRQGIVRRWEVASGKPLGEPFRHEEAVRCVAFSPDGTIILTSSLDRTTHFWDAATGQRIATCKHQHPVVEIHFSADGRTFIALEEQSTAQIGGQMSRTVAQLWDAETKQPIGKPLVQEGSIVAAVFSPDNKIVATAGGDLERETGEARLWDTATSKPLGPPLVHQDRINALAFSPDGRMLVTGSSDYTARLWNVATGRQVGPPIRTFRNPQKISAVAFSPDGKEVLASGADDPVQVWKVPAPLKGEVEQVDLWVQVIGGKQRDAGGGIRLFDFQEWRRQRGQLANVPRTDPTMTAPLQERRKRYKDLQPDSSINLGNFAAVGG